MLRRPDVAYDATRTVRDACLCPHTQRAARARRRLVSPTPDGRRLLAEALPIWRRTHDEIEAALGPTVPERRRRRSSRWRRAAK